MNRYVDADELIKSCDMVIKFGIADKDGKHSVSVESVKEKVESLPTADVRKNVRGEWMECGDSLRCSNCFSVPYFKDIRRLNFCSNCGADMRERSEDEQIH